MSEIRPFKGIRYNGEKVNLGAVVSPPYDVISEDLQNDLYARSPHNIVRIILGADGDDGPGADKYERAKNYLDTWLAEGVLVREAEEAIYIYSESFSAAGRQYERTGFIALTRLVDFYQGVLPHEKTLKGPIVDRMNLTKAARTQTGQIFSMYNDREKKTDAVIAGYMDAAPLADITCDAGIRHRLWKLSDPSDIAAIVGAMREFEIIIADGHHRYTTALQYAKDNPDNEAAQYIMMTFVNSFSEGMAIFPTNRLLHSLDSVPGEELETRLGEYFEMKEMADGAALTEKLDTIPVMIDKEKNLKNHVFGLYDTVRDRHLLLTLKDNTVLSRRMPEVSDVYAKLDVNIAHKLIIEEILGVSEEMQKEGSKITYVKGNEDTIKMLADGSYRYGLFVRPPLMREIFLTAQARETMPQKATYFYPKVWTGFVMYPLG